MKVEVTDKKFMSWSVVVFFLVICFPLGAVLSLIKANTEVCRDRKNIRKIQKVMIANVILLTISCMAYIAIKFLNVGFTEYLNIALGVSAVLLATLLITAICSKAIKSKNRMYESYMRIIKDMEEFHVSTVANAVDLPRSKVKDDLIHMINSGYIVNAQVGKDGEICAI